MGSGLKPKSFFAETKDWYRSRLVQSDSKIKAKNSRYTYRQEEGIKDPYLRELSVMAPWILLGAVLLVSVFS
ncbi:MAG: hypothetical protein IPM26_07685 [Saprospiraceae bacterium]|nr:hypothetical protein [Saprospiraceae bacterium]